MLSREDNALFLIIEIEKGVEASRVSEGLDNGTISGEYALGKVNGTTE